MRKFIKDRKGSLFVELIIKLIVIAILLLNAINLFDVVLKYQHVSFASKTIAQTVELEGALTSLAYDQMDNMNSNFGMDMSFDISNVSYFNASAHTIQFRDPFTITISYTYKYIIATPLFTATPVSIDIPMRATVNGMSEVYWKP